MANPVRFQSKKFIAKDVKRLLNERNVKETVRLIVIHLEASQTLHYSATTLTKWPPDNYFLQI